jgi:hypothetical protein
MRNKPERRRCDTAVNAMPSPKYLYNTIILWYTILRFGQDLLGSPQHGPSASHAAKGEGKVDR